MCPWDVLVVMFGNMTLKTRTRKHVSSYGHTRQTVDFMSTTQDIGGGPQKADLLALPHLRSHKIDGISQ